jgi:hypothetical protein
MLQKKSKVGKFPSKPIKYEGLGIRNSQRNQKKLNIEEKKRGCNTSKQKLEEVGALLVDSV